ncbi:MAG: hypothetical protein KDD22_01540 [Bdellovibrionales bacterium]|nr:hypothetical protein [Bdellovibrionales bacterium]
MHFRQLIVTILACAVPFSAATAETASDTSYYKFLSKIKGSWIVNKDGDLHEREIVKSSDKIWDVTFEDCNSGQCGHETIQFAISNNGLLWKGIEDESPKAVNVLSTTESELKFRIQNDFYSKETTLILSHNGIEETSIVTENSTGNVLERSDLIFVRTTP